MVDERSVRTVERHLSFSFGVILIRNDNLKDGSVIAGVAINAFFSVQQEKNSSPQVRYFDSPLFSLDRGEPGQCGVNAF